MSGAPAAEAEARWLSVLRAVRQQLEIEADAEREEQRAQEAAGTGGLWVKLPKSILGLLEEQEAGEHRDPRAWPAAQWLNAFTMLLLERPASLDAGGGHDDMLFFVLHDGETEQGPFLVRRRGAALPPELGAGGGLCGGVDWRASLLLNLVLQTDFRLSAAVQPAGGGGRCAAKRPAAGVCGRVWASPVRAARRAGGAGSGREAAGMQACYPAICFAVEGTHAGFADLVLRRPNEALSLRLTAAPVPGLADPDGPVGPEPPPAPAAAPVAAAAAAAQRGSIQLLAAGFSYGSLGQQLRAAEGLQGLRQQRPAPAAELDADCEGEGEGQARLRLQWLRDSGHLLQPDRDLPEGEKQQQQQQQRQWQQQQEQEKQRQGGWQLDRVVRLLRRAGQQAAPPPQPPPGLQCALLELSLPVEQLAPAVLGLPPPPQQQRAQQLGT